MSRDPLAGFVCPARRRLGRASFEAAKALQRLCRLRQIVCVEPPEVLRRWVFSGIVDAPRHVSGERVTYLYDGGDSVFLGIGTRLRASVACERMLLSICLLAGGGGRSIRSQMPLAPRQVPYVDSDRMGCSFPSVYLAPIVPVAPEGCEGRRLRSMCRSLQAGLGGARTQGSQGSQEW